MNMKQRTLPGIEFARALSRQLVSSQSYLLGRFVKWAARAWHRVSDHAPRLENTAPFLRRDPPHSLRGNGPLAAICNKLSCAGCSKTMSSCRHGAPIIILAISSWRCCPPSWPDSDVPTRQKFCSTTVPSCPGWASRGSRPVHLAPIPEREEYPIRPSARQLARSMARSTLSSAPTANPAHPRSPFGGPHRLWPTAICSRRVQPQETRATLLPPDHLLRGPLARVLAGLSAARHAVTATGGVAFVQRCLDKVPFSLGWSRVRIRADSGCFGR